MEEPEMPIHYLIDSEETVDRSGDANRNTFRAKDGYSGSMNVVGGQGHDTFIGSHGHDYFRDTGGACTTAVCSVGADERQNQSAGTRNNGRRPPDSGRGK